MTLPHFGFEHFEVEVAGPSHGGIGTLSRSIGVPRISKMFAPVSPNLATNRQNPTLVAQAPGGVRGGATFLPGTWPLLAGPFVFWNLSVTAPATPQNLRGVRYVAKLPELLTRRVRYRLW
jgi:hypothetical protein